jgi:DNA-binding transcriptional LysR family regulator
MRRLSAMQMFVRVVETGSFSAVAHQMNTTQPTISKRIAELERELGGKLLNRSTRSLRLTEVGSVYYESCLNILYEIEQAEHNVSQAQSMPKGNVRISAVSSFGRQHIIPKLSEFFDAYPEINTEVLLDDHNVDLVEQAIDVAFRMGTLADSNLIAKKLCLSPMITVATPAYLDKFGTPQHPADLRQHQCILYTGIGQQNMLRYRVDGQPFSVNVNGRLTTNNTEGMREALIAGLGITKVPHWLVGDLIASGQVVKALDDFEPEPIDIYAVYSSARYLPQKTRVLIEYFTRVFGCCSNICG